MYWIFLILFIICILIPEIINGPIGLLPKERAQEVAIFLLGTLGFFTFVINERKLFFQKKEKEKAQKRAKQTVKDLVESYSYIGEVNRKMDILMNIALGISERSALDKNREKEIYESIVSAANFLMKGEISALRFINIKSERVAKEVKTMDKKLPIKNNELIEMKEEGNIKKHKGCLIISGSQKINNIKSFIIIHGYDEEEEKNPKNLEILKVFASQAIFLYSYIQSNKVNNC
jgi:hypothetical protein